MLQLTEVELHITQLSWPAHFGREGEFHLDEKSRASDKQTSPRHRVSVGYCGPELATILSESALLVADSVAFNCSP